MSLVLVPTDNDVMAANDSSSKGNKYGWTMSNGNKHGLVKQGKIIQEPIQQTVTYSAGDIVAGHKTVQENQTVIFDNYKITLNGGVYTITKNGEPFKSGSAVGSTLKLIYEPAGSYISLELFNNETSYSTEGIPLMLAFVEDGFTSQIGLLFGVSEYGDVLYAKGHYTRWDESTNTVTIEKDGAIIEEFYSSTSENLMMGYWRSTGITGLYINGELVYIYN